MGPCWSVRAVMGFRVWHWGFQISGLPTCDDLRCSRPTHTSAQTSQGAAPREVVSGLSSPCHRVPANDGPSILQAQASPC